MQPTKDATNGKVAQRLMSADESALVALECPSCNHKAISERASLHSNHIDGDNIVVHCTECGSALKVAATAIPVGVRRERRRVVTTPTTVPPASSASPTRDMEELEDEDEDEDEASADSETSMEHEDEDEMDDEEEMDDGASADNDTNTKPSSKVKQRIAKAGANKNRDRRRNTRNQVQEQLEDVVGQRGGHARRRGSGKSRPTMRRESPSVVAPRCGSR